MGILFKKKPEICERLSGRTALTAKSKSSSSMAMTLAGKANGSSAEITSPTRQTPNTTPICKIMFIKCLFLFCGRAAQGSMPSRLSSGCFAKSCKNFLRITYRQACT